MAARKKTNRRGSPKGRGGSSGGANPRTGGREISEQQHDEAVRVLRAEYYTGVRGIVEEIQQAIKDGEITDRDSLDDRLHQTIDGSYWIIYTHANHQVIFVSDNHDAYSEDFGSAPVEGDSINWAALAFAAMQRDVQELMDAEGVEIPEGGGDLEEAAEDRRRGYKPRFRPGDEVEVASADSMYRGWAGTVVSPDANRMGALGNHERDLIAAGYVLVQKPRGSLFVVPPADLIHRPSGRAHESRGSLGERRRRAR